MVVATSDMSEIASSNRRPVGTDRLTEWKLTALRDLEVRYIWLDSLSHNLITLEEWSEIKEVRKSEEQVRLLLELVDKKGKSGYQSLVAVLEHDYDWLAQDLEEVLEDEAVKWPIPDVAGSGRQSSTLEEPDSRADYYAVNESQCRVFGVPVPPPQLVSRPVVDEIRQRLATMKRNDVVALHAMTGAGKSVVAQDVVADDAFVRGNFPGGVFWLNIGQSADKQEMLLAKMQTLYEKFLMTTGDERVVSDESRQAFPTSVELGKCKLQKLARAQSGPILLVLDDVWSRKVIDAFDVGCGILLTCRDVGVVNHLRKRATSVKISTSFTQDESLELLSLLTETSRENLPPEARQIHEEARGLPMAIALIGGILATNRRPDKWGIYLKKLRDGAINRMTMDSVHERSIYDAVALSYEALGDGSVAQKRYRALAVFMSDSIFSSEALCSLWSSATASGDGAGAGDDDEIEVPSDTDQQAEALVKKSLLSSYFENNTYKYFLHGLQHNYLRHITSDEERKALHRKLLNWYLLQVPRSDGSGGNRLRDEYFLWQIGYHLVSGRMTHWFARLYLNLDFVSEKIAVTGPSDLLNDYEKYKEHIDYNQDCELDVVSRQSRMDFENFVRINSHQLIQREVDILQLALSAPSNSAVFTNARETVSRRRNRLYFECCGENQQRSSLMLTKLHASPVTSCILLPQINCVIVGNASGQITVWDPKSGTEIVHWLAHDRDSKVTSLQLVDAVGATEAGGGSPPPSTPVRRPQPQHQKSGHDEQQFLIRFVSTSTDATAKVWRILFDASSSAQSAATALKRRSRHLSTSSMSPAPTGAGAAQPQWDRLQESRPSSWASPDETSVGRGTGDLCGSRTGSTTSLASYGSSTHLTTPSPTQSSFPTSFDTPVCPAEFTAHVHAHNNGDKLAEAHAGIWCCSVHPNRASVATGDASGTVRIWSPDTAREQDLVLVVPPGFGLEGKSRIGACAFGPGSAAVLLATGNDHSVVRLWDFRKATILYAFNSHRLPIVGIHFLDESEIISVSQGSIIKWRYKDIVKQATSRGNRQESRRPGAALDADVVDGPRRASSYFGTAGGGFGAAADSSTMRRTSGRSRLLGGSGTATAAAAAANGGSGSSAARYGQHGGSLAEPGGLEFVLPHKSMCLTSDLSSDGKYLVVGTEAKGVVIWNAEDAKCRSFQRPLTGRVEVVKFGQSASSAHQLTRQMSTSAATLLSGSQSTTVLHDVEKLVDGSVTFTPHFDAMWQDGECQIALLDWELTRPHLLRRSLVPHVDGVARSSSAATVPDAEQNDEQRRSVTTFVLKPSPFSGKVSCMAVVPATRGSDGGVALGLSDGSVLLGRPDGQVKKLHSHAGAVTCVEVNRTSVGDVNGNPTMTIASGGTDGFVHIWPSRVKIKKETTMIQGLKIVESWHSLDERHKPSRKSTSDELLISCFSRVMGASVDGHDSTQEVEFSVHDLKTGQLNRTIGAFPAHPGVWGGHDFFLGYSLTQARAEKRFNSMCDCSGLGDTFAFVAEPVLVKLFKWSTGEHLRDIRTKSLWDDAREQMLPGTLSVDSRIAGGANATRAEVSRTGHSANPAVRPTSISLAASAFSSLSIEVSRKGSSSAGKAGQFRITVVKFSPDGSRLVLGDSAGNVKVWSTTSFTHTYHLQAREFGPICDLSFSSCSRLLVVAGGGKLAWWSLSLVHPDDSAATPGTPGARTPTMSASGSAGQPQPRGFGRQQQQRRSDDRGRSGRDSAGSSSMLNPRYEVRGACMEVDEWEDEVNEEGEQFCAGKLRFGLSDDARDVHYASSDGEEEETPTPSPATSLVLTPDQLARVRESARQLATNSSFLAAALQQEAAQRRNRRFGRAEDRPPVTRHRDGDNNNNNAESQCPQCRSILHTKRGGSRNPSLLQVFEVGNGPVRRVVAGPDFREFVTVDDAGSVYLLKAVTSSMR